MQMKCCSFNLGMRESHILLPESSDSQPANANYLISYLGRLIKHNGLPKISARI